ncbi:MAG: hypothetical protein A2315_10865 [Ignavibacteria bacterium RIFOXYB2_FULL_35_12]|nr:MAG: hypothetical protein A2058_03415 [Ignavibacteria bacterium GWA2_36_19]OGU61489.1 MAG: hypothetical protein A2X60_02100 [Ignavibacteria bacterium GWF2_35_20]OGU78551.1 MAG: hypothetical protein A2254_05990 [Ignavibacteria bacterium RIFOXYA2_FULL_35_9]OGU85521.1 MAG: hypothetical protein A3K31_05170 [Ignavibacteria bacterium RIFOXYA12_FULL_35_25]OGU90290.1 MAG: hypothetical protein A2492_10020 [Ignavibacteria bacterium RIFOXYC12_FULL_35_11]OGU96726.1 MAG: hypothetical protein A2347_05060
MKKTDNKSAIRDKIKSPLKNLITFNLNKLSDEDLLSNWDKELETLRIIPIMDEKRDLLVKSFFDSNKSIIDKNIKSSASIKSAVQELNHVFNPDDVILDLTLRTTGFFVRNIVKLVLTLEINYLMHVKENLMDNKILPSYKNIVEGELINYDLKKETLELKEAPFKNLLSSIGTLIYIYAKTLNEKNSEWRELYFALHRERFYDKADVVSQEKKKSHKEIFISQIKIAKEKLIKMNPGKKITISEVARELGYTPKRRQTFVDRMDREKINFDEI